MVNFTLVYKTQYHGEKKPLQATLKLKCRHQYDGRLAKEGGSRKERRLS